MEKTSTEKISYYLFSPTTVSPQFADLHDRCFSSWYETIYHAFLETNQTDVSHLHDDFIRQDVVGCITIDGQVAATFLHAFSSIDLKAARTYRYFKNNYPENFFVKLQSFGIRKVLTVNYLAVDAKWRKRTSQLSLAPVMLALSQRIRDYYGLDAVIGVYRNDRKVNDLAYSLGGECVIKDVQNHNTPCDLIVMNKSRPYQYPNSEMEALVSTLWQNRTDLTHRETNQTRQTARYLQGEMPA